MPTLRKASAKRGRSRSPARASSRSRSRSRGRSPGRPRKSPSRAKPAEKVSTSTKETQKTSPSPRRKTRSDTQVIKTPSTPSRRSDSPITKTPTPSRRSVRIESHAKNEPEKNPVSSRTRQGQSAEKQKCTLKDLQSSVVAILYIIIQPLVLLYINEACSEKSCDFRKLPAIPKEMSAYVNKESALLVLGFVAVHVVLALVPIGKLVEGRPLKGGRRLKYRCNGLFAFVVTLLALGVGVYRNVPIGFVLVNFRQLIVTSILLCLILSTVLCISARKLNASAKASNTGNMIYDFYMGKELNPRIGSFDLKFFCLRLCYIAWGAVNGCFLAISYQRGFITPALALCAAGQILYCLDLFIFERSVLNGLDITSEGLGFMLLFCDLSWIPFLHTLSTRFLLMYPQNLSNYVLGAVLLLNLVGYIVYRGANNQKNKIIQNPQSPDLAHLETIPTSSGRKLLISGWWGLCRHPNYLGDCMMILAWSCYCGTASIIPYVYPIYFVVHMALRQHWDDQLCQQKYGAAWDRYCERVRYRLIPYIY